MILHTRKKWSFIKAVQGRSVSRFAKHLIQNAYYPSQEISNDKWVIGTKAGIRFVQYMPKKPAKLGVKVSTCCESLTGFSLQLQIHTGKVEGTAEKNITHCVAMDSASPYFSKCH